MAILGVAGRSFVESASNVESTNSEFTYDNAITWARQFDALHDKVPEQYRVGIKSEYEMNNWIREIVPFFEYENVVDDLKPDDPNGLYYPDAEFEDYQGGLEHNHILGQANIFSRDITLNARFSNPASPWYGREDALSTLVHELAHAQGIMTPGERIDTESSAQLVTLEIMSAMANRGNRLLIAPLLDDLRWMSLSAGKYLALQEGNIESWLKVRNELFDSSLDQASLNKADRFWLQDPKRLEKILYQYNYTPIVEVYKAYTNDQMIEGVKLPINWMEDWANMPDYQVPAYYSSSPATPEPTPTPLPTKPLVIDDLSYFITNAKEMVNDL